MSKSSRPNRPYVRRGRNSSSGASPASELAGSAGVARVRSSIEALEARKLLFSMTVTDDPDGDGIGSVVQQFAYLVPFLLKEIPDESDAETVVEEFEDEAAPWTTQNPATPPNGTFFEQSGIRITYSTISTQPVQRVVGNDTQPDGTQTDDFDMLVNLTVDDSVTFAFFDTQEINPAPPLITRLLQNVALTIGGLDVDPMTGSKIELLSGGVVVQTLRGAQLNQIRAQVAAGGGTPEQTSQNFRYNIVFPQGFDAVRISSSAPSPDNATYMDRFYVDDITQVVPTGRFGSFNEERIFAVEVRLTGPIGASAEFLDLYGRQIIATLALGVPPNGEVALVDRNDDGVPDFNDGIGRINLTGTDERTVLTLVGGTVEEMNNNPFVFQLVGTTVGLYDDMQQAGFGFGLTNDNPPVPTALPPGTGSIVVGSPFIRDNSDPGTYLNDNPNVNAHNFTNVNQGIFVTQPGRSMGSITYHGMLMGSSQFAGALGRLNVGVLYGSVTVQGDLGFMYVAGDAGAWVSDVGNQPRALNSTRNELFVGRTVGEIAIGGRSLLDVTVAANINDPNRPALRFYEYDEKEHVYGIDPGTPDGVRVSNQLLVNIQDPTAQPMFFGDSYYRNDTVAGAEYVGYGGTTVHISGTLNLQDPVNTNEDPADVYAFSVDGSTDVVVSLFFDVGQVAAVGLVRIVDSEGRVVASHQSLSEPGSGQALLDPTTGQFTFRPDGAGIYYLVVNAPQDGNFGTNVSYEATIAGMAPTTLGAYRTGAGNGGRATDPPANNNVLQVAAGNVGLVRIGTGFQSADGTEKDLTPFGNPDTGDMDDMFQFRFSTITVAGSLYGLWTGSDINGAQVFVGGNLGSFVTGQSPVIGTGIGEGDIEAMTLNVGGTIGRIFVSGAIGWNQDPPANTNTGADVVNISTGLNGGPGHIGSFLVGNFISGQALNVRTSAGSIIDTFIIGASPGGSGQVIGSQVPEFMMGIGSDIRFADFASIEGGSDPDVFQPLVFGQTLTFSDDGGGTVSIRITGAAPGQEAAAATSFGAVRLLPINNSLGSAIARLDITLNGGAVLEILGTTAGVVSIGRINVTTDGTGGSQIVINSNVTEIDVHRIVQLGGAGLGVIRNGTPRGDLVSVDVAGLNQLIILNGDLGKTQVSGAGPALLGNFLGIARGYVTATGGALGVNAGSIDPQWNGTVFLPINFPTAVINRDETLEDLGGPFDGYLNGLVVRNGNVLEVRVAGSVGDVILQGGVASVLTTLIANFDNTTVLGRFDGIVGTIYAGDIINIDVGDGLAAPGSSPFASAGIFADDDIISVGGRPNLHPVIRGVIIARNANPGDGAINQNGLVSVRLVQGRYDGAFMGSTKFDEYWNSARYSYLDNGGDDLNAGFRGPVVSIVGQFSDLFRSRIVGGDIAQVNFTSGVWDASSADATGSIGIILADEFRNTTILGEPAERRVNEIRASGNIAQISAAGSAGDISDLLVDAQGSLTAAILARNITRADFQIDGTVNRIFAANDIRSTNLTAGRLTLLDTTNDIRASSINVAGPITTLMAGSNITNTRIVTTGPDGRIDTIRTRFFLTGEIISSGAVTLITSTEGDIIASISTTSPTATLGTLSAGRDIIIDADLASDVNLIMAGRHVGQLNEPRGARAINIRGNLNMISAANGQVYTDVRVAQAITGSIITGRVAALPGNDQVSRASIIAYGRINALDLHGDFNGSIISEFGGIGSITITDGSFRPGNVIRANDGSIDSVLIIGGHLMGDIIAEEAIGSVVVAPNAAGFWGDIGVNPHLSQFAFFDPLRNQLPPNVQANSGFQGPRIQAGTNIGLVDVQRASMWEGSIVAGHSIGHVHVFGVVLNDTITPGLGGTFIVAGDTINSVDIEQFAGGTIILAGVTNLGADNRPGGTGENADTVQFGRIGNLIFRGGTGALTIGAGMNAGPDGFYTLNPGPDGVRGTGDDINDDEVANGLSFINSVTVFGQALQTTVYADNGIGFTSDGIIRGGPGLNQAEPNKVIEFVPTSGQVPSGGLGFTTTAGEQGFITLTGPGQAYFEHVFDAALGRNINRLTLINTSLESRLIVDAATNKLTDFRILSNDSASLGSASIRANLFGDSSFYFDGYVQFAEFGALDMTGSIGAGNDMGSVIVGPTTRGFIDANHIQSIIVGGAMGVANLTGEAGIRLLSGGSIIVGGPLAGLISVKRDVGSVQVFGALNNAEIRAGRSITSINTGALTNARISAGNNINSVTVGGDVTGSSIYAGTDLGADGRFGGTGANADIVSNGSLDLVNVSGNFVRSDIAAGVTRGPDNFLGTADDLVDEGHSAIGSVTISGTQVGSALNSESFRIVSNGTVGQVRVGSDPNFQAAGNFAVARVLATPDALNATDLRVQESAGVYTARITFNQPIVLGTLSPALNIFEVRDNGTRTVRLAENVDFTLAYDANSNTAVITFNQTVTQRNLPQANGVPGPGVYRFSLDAAILRGQTQGAMLDGNANGVPEGVNDDWSEDAIVGDAGDKIDPDLNDGNNAGVVVNGPNGERVDYYFAADLNVMLDNNYTPDGLPDVNRVYNIFGSLGDHPDHSTNFFPFSADYDVYRITLRAGQILRLGKMEGVAVLADRQLLDANGNIISGSTANVLELPATPPDFVDVTTTLERQYLILQTGTYYLAVAAPVIDGVASDENSIPTNETIAGAVGRYNFTLEVFDDGDTGFNADTDSGNGSNVANAPAPIAFAGNDGQFGTSDDVASIDVGPYRFFLNVGGDNAPNTFDDLVSGSNGSGITSQRTAGNDGQFGTADDALVSFVDASIGRSGATGVPNEIQPDADVYRLNNGDPIAPGTRVRATIQLTELGSNLGLTSDPSIQDLRGNVQFGIFNISNAIGVAGADLLAAPGQFIPIGGKPGEVTTDGVTSYGFDGNGDFFIEFIVPADQGTTPGRFALYIQGAMRTDYQLSVVTSGTGTAVRTTQNVLIETRGGTIDWLEAGGTTTTLSSFKASVLGFTGLIDGQTVDNYIINNLVGNLIGVYAAAGVDINISADPSAFEGQEFSTIFLTSSNEPIAFFDNGTFGAVEQVDAFNVNHNDQGVVFAPSLGVLGYSPSRTDVDSFVQSLTAAVGRRVGELVGLRVLHQDDASPTDIMSADSVRNVSPNGGTPLPGPYRYSNQSVRLSPPELRSIFLTPGGLDRAINTDFYLGRQNSDNLLDRLLLPG